MPAKRKENKSLGQPKDLTTPSKIDTVEDVGKKARALIAKETSDKVTETLKANNNLEKQVLSFIKGYKGKVEKTSEIVNGVEGVNTRNQARKILRKLQEQGKVEMAKDPKSQRYRYSIA